MKILVTQYPDAWAKKDTIVFRPVRSEIVQSEGER